MATIFHKTSKKAIAYYRHSAEDKQENSVAIQRTHVHRFANQHTLEIIHEEADEGISGLLAKRPGFERIFRDWVENPDAPSFEYILVYDVSRWGRFQDQDQAGHYVYLCKKHNKEVIYVSQGFPDQSNRLFSSLEISIQRYMAAEYSRQLSEKVFHGCVKVSQQGFSAGGPAVYGMARQLLDSHKKPVRILKAGEHKQIANERVTFTPKNDVTTETVRKIFHLFVIERSSLEDICIYLNRVGVLSANGREWDKRKIVKVLQEEAYIGTRIYNKTWGRLKQKQFRNLRSEWVIVPNAFDPVIHKDLFDSAQERLYWLLPGNWRKGVYSINRVRKKIHKDILNWLLSRGGTQCQAEEIIKEIPILFSVEVGGKTASSCCFLINEHFKAFENVLAISVSHDSKGKANEFFILSPHDFTSTNFLILTENSSLYSRSKIGENEVQRCLVNLFKQLKMSKPWTRNKYQFIDNDFMNVL